LRRPGVDLFFWNARFGLVGRGLGLFGGLRSPAFCQLDQVGFTAALGQVSSLRLDVNPDVRYTAQPAIDIQWSLPRMRLVLTVPPSFYRPLPRILWWEVKSMCMVRVCSAAHTYNARNWISSAAPHWQQNKVAGGNIDSTYPFLPRSSVR